jgi:hypothetical protein
MFSLMNIAKRTITNKSVRTVNINFTKVSSQKIQFNQISSHEIVGKHIAYNWSIGAITYWWTLLTNVKVRLYSQSCQVELVCRSDRDYGDFETGCTLGEKCCFAPSNNMTVVAEIRIDVPDNKTRCDNSQIQGHWRWLSGFGLNCP